ncbi:MAG: hypothetical protein ACKVW3_10725 [Phycisphaerales bacterium]
MNLARSVFVIPALASTACAQPTLLYMWPSEPPPMSVARVIDVSPGYGANLDVREGGTLLAWGQNNSSGQQGFLPGPFPPNGNNYPPTSACAANPLECVAPPVQMPLLRRASVGFDHTLALVMDPASYPAYPFGLLGWGHSNYGQAEIPNLTGVPWLIEPTAKVADLQVGEYINIVLFDNGQIAAWGDDRYGVHPIERPNGPLQPDLYRPYLPPADWRFKEIVCGGHAVGALRYDPQNSTNDGQIICWGSFDEQAVPQSWGPNYRGTIPAQDPPGIPAWFAPYSPPYVHIAAGHWIIIGVNADGTPHIWGSNESWNRTDQPRDQTIHQQPPPIKMGDIVAGYAQWELARRLDTGEIVGWGSVGTQGPPAGAPSGPLSDLFIMVRGNANLTQAFARCYDANCDGSTTTPLLSVNDFICFGNAFAAAQNLPYEQHVVSYANCDGSIWPPVLTVNDYQCFNNAFVSPCPTGSMP